MIHLINMCNKFVALNVLMAKLSDPKARIDPDDLHCLEFKEFGTIPEDEDLFWALKNIADQVQGLMVRAKGTQWHEYDERRKTQERLKILGDAIVKMLAKQTPWEI